MSHPAPSGQHVRPEPDLPTLNLVRPVDRPPAPDPTPAGGVSGATSPVRLAVLGGDPSARGRMIRLLTAPGVTTVGVDERLEGPADIGCADIGLILLPTAEPLPEIIRRLLATRVVRRVVILSGPDQIAGSALVETLIAGADGWLEVDLPPEVLLRAVRGILRGEAGVSRRHVAELIASLREPARGTHPVNSRTAGLTPREHEIFLALTTSGSVRSIASTLSLSEGTVRWYTGRLLRKLKVSSRSELSHLLTDGPAADEPATPPAPALKAVPDRPAASREPAAGQPAPVIPAAWHSLPRSELRVVQLVVTGLTNRQIAEALFLSKHTVDSHLKSAFIKLGVRSRVELTVLAHRTEA